MFWVARCIGGFRRPLRDMVATQLFLGRVDGV
jgi:hypothetical protein